MAIYVQSCGISQDNDYRWLKIKENNQIPEIPPILKRHFSGAAGTKVYVTDMIDSKTPSIVLARSDGELLLLVTGLKAKEERADFNGRPVRNSVAWTFNDSPENEQVIRSLAVRALREELESKIDEAVTVGGKYGFEVSFEKIEQLSVQSENIKRLDAEQPIRIGANSPEFKEFLALELEQHCLLKENDRLLVVVTRIKSEDALRQSRVWRALSTRVTAQKWIEIPPETVIPVSSTSGVSQNQQQNQQKNTTILWGGAAVALVILLLLVLLVRLLIPLKLEPDITPSPPKATPQAIVPIKVMLPTR